MDGLGDLPARGVLGQEAVGTGLHRPGDRLFSPGEDGPHFTMREAYSGPLLPLIWRSMPDLGPSFRQFASGLKQRAEG